ncbi:MAG: efflux RND transporter periplasmic adaptor subunit [Thiobacillus sp.]
MNKHKLKQAAVLTLVAALAAGAGVWWARRDSSTTNMTMPASNAGDAKKPLYWYDPMFPQQRFDAPGKSPFMDMQLVPKYADENGDASAPGVSIDAAASQNLGMRLASVTRGTVTSDIAASGVLAFNERDVAIVQSKRAGFVERVFARAPGDVIAAGAPLANVLVPEWAGAQQEFLALLSLGDPALIQAGRTRLRLMGMPDALIRRVEQRRQTQAISTITSPIGGVIQALDVRAGMTLSPGQTMARINGLGTVWLDVAVPEAQTGGVRIGQQVSALLPAYPGESFSGKVSAILPEASLDTRSVRVRVELPNRGARLKPGMTAQVRIAAGDAASVLRVPSEALIRTGKRTLVMVADKPGRYRPVEVQIGAESGEFTAITDGLQEGQQVVVSGQFLLDSEASLTGITTQPAPQMPAAMPLHASQGDIVELSKTEVTIKHGPFKTLNMPGMTMSFTLARPELAQSLKVGDTVQFAVREADDGLIVERIEKAGAR